MIFDERDLDEIKDEEKKEDIIPLNSQMSLDEIAKNVKSFSRNMDSKMKNGISSKSKVDISLKIKNAMQDLNNIIEKKKEEKFRKDKNMTKKQFGVLQDQKNIYTPTLTASTNYDDEGNLLKTINEVMHESMLPYSEFVILDRALPRVEDGLKPVQRRILYSMYELGLTPDKPFKKSAKVVGDCIAKYHPHGDSSVYNAIVRLAQNFNMRECLVSGHGNFGSMDGDGAAAMRYTECKLTNLSLELLRDIDKDTVRWSYTYDDSSKEPDMLPGRFPNLLVNGASGIAVGLATNFAPHNLADSIDAVCAYIDDNDISTAKLLKIIKGPDFPTGAIIENNEELFRAYETGKGKITIRSKIFIEDNKDRKNIVISEFPYQVNKAALLQKIAALKDNNKDLLGGINEIRDESDRNGVRAVICLKPGVNPDKILAYLLKYTELQTTFGINMVAIANGKPQLLSLRDILAYYSEYQREVVLKRTKFDLESYKEREHILKGLIIAIVNIDEVIKIIKKSSSTVEAKTNLRAKFSLSDKQAQAILDMRLSRLTNLEVVKLKQELEFVTKEIARLTTIANSKRMQYNIVKQEMGEIKKQFKSSRKTAISKFDGETDVMNELDETVIKNAIIAVNEKGGLKAITEKNYNMTSRVISDSTTFNEIHNQLIYTTTDSTLYIMTNLGNCYCYNTNNIPLGKWKDKGLILKDLLPGYFSDESVVRTFVIDDKQVKDNIVMFTKLGYVKKSSVADYLIKKSSFVAIKLKENDEVVGVEIENNAKEMLFVTKYGMCLHAETNDIPLQGRISSGVKGINLNDNDNVVFAGLVTTKDNFIICTNKAYSKIVSVEDLPLLSRACKGLKVITFSDDNGARILYADVIHNKYQLYMLDDKDESFSFNVFDSVKESRTTKGKPMFKKGKTIRLKKIYKYEWEYQDDSKVK